jgi:hypothetical protein
VQICAPFLLTKTDTALKTRKAETVGDSCRKEAIVRQHAANIGPTIAELQAAGATTLQAIADGLNRSGIPTPRGWGQWRPVQVARVLARI